MKRTILTVIFIILLFPGFSKACSATDDVLVFYDLHCDHCQEILKDFWPQVVKEKNLTTRYYEVNTGNNYKILLEIEEKLHDKENEFPIFVIGDRVFDLYQIQTEMLEYIESSSEKKFPYTDLLEKGKYLDKPKWDSDIPDPVQDDGKVNLIYFFEVGCKVCARVTSHLNYLNKQYPSIKVIEYEAEGSETLGLLQAFLITYKIPEDVDIVPSVFFGTQYLLSDDLTFENLESMIRDEIDKKIDPLELVKPNIEAGQNKILEIFEKITFLAIIIAGLIDGINPCAFATLLFFISYLTVVGRTKKEILVVSLGFAATVFLTYFAISLGLFHALRGLTFLPRMAKYIYFIMGAVTLLFAVLSFYDFIQYRKGHFEKGVLQVSSKMRNRINRVIKKEGKIHNLLIGAIVTGFLVSLLEFTCTGQVLVPTLGAVLSHPELRVRSLLWIFLYNVAFIAPLLVIFFLFYNGVSSEKLGKFWRAESPAIKFIMGIVFILLGTLIIYFGVFR